MHKARHTCTALHCIAMYIVHCTLYSVQYKVDEYSFFLLKLKIPPWEILFDGDAKTLG